MANPWTEELVYTTTEDNILLAGIAITPSSDGACNDSLVWIHGNAANFYEWFYTLAGRELAERGFTVVLGNTRGHDIAATLWLGDSHLPMAGGGGSGWERMEESPRDVAAWVDFAAARVSGKVLLAGHSQGAQKVLLYAAERPSEQLGGVALISPALDTVRIPGDLEAARALIAEGRGTEVLPAHPWAPWYRQSARNAVSTSEAADRMRTAEGRSPVLAAVRVPLFAVFGGGEGDLTILNDQLAIIRENAPAAPQVTTEIIGVADHFYREQEANVVQAIAQWARSL
jgi:pimeloyl-ACP methyl ester carboxylesterase